MAVVIRTNSSKALIMPVRPFITSLRYAAKALVPVGLFALAGLLVGTYLEHRIATQLPRPTGVFAVGRTQFPLVDHGHPDDLAPGPGSERELAVWVWYPAVGEGPHAEYLPPPWRAALAQAGGFLMTVFLTRDLAKVRVHSLENAALSPALRRYPVVILRAGLAALVTSYTTLAEDLASHGYIVVAPDAPYRTAVVVLPGDRVIFRPNEDNLELLPEVQQASFATRLVKMWSSDLSFLVDELVKLDAVTSSRFFGRLDLEHLGALGHSLGGATVAAFCHDDPRCKAVVDLDGQLFGPIIEQGLGKPFLFILEDHDQLTNRDNRDILSHLRSTYPRLPEDSRIAISLSGSNHFSFSDQILPKSQLLLGIMRRSGAIGGLEGYRGLRITAECISTFFDVYLKGKPRANLEWLKRSYPEVRDEVATLAGRQD